MPNEAGTCRRFVVPRLQATGWDNEPHPIAEQWIFTEGRNVVRGNQTGRYQPKRADYLLRYNRNFPIAVVQAKAEYNKTADVMQQSKDYAQILDQKFAYAPNGGIIFEFDFNTGLERKVPVFRQPQEILSTQKTRQEFLAIVLPYYICQERRSYPSMATCRGTGNSI